MLNNYYTLLHLSLEFSNSLSSSRILQASTRLKHTLEILFQTQKGGMAKLVVSCLPHANFIYVETSVGSKMKGANVLPEIVGKMVAAVGVVKNERQLYFEFSDRNFLRINLFGSAANVYYTDSVGTVINSFLKPSANIGRHIVINADSVDFPVDGADLQLRFQNTIGDMAHRLSKCVPTVDAILAREISYRYHELLGRPLGRETDDQIDFEILLRVFSEIRNELLTPSPRIYFSEHDEIPAAFGLIELKYLQMKKFKRCDSVNECVRGFAISSDKNKKAFVVKTEVMRKLSKKVDSIRRTLAKIESDLNDDRAEKYQAFGEYMMSHLSDIKQGDASIFIDNGRTEIRLDPALKPVQNAQAFFKKSKQARVSIRQAGQRKKGLTKELQETEALLDRVEQQNDVSLAKLLKKDGASSKWISSDEEGRRSPFREFERNGYRIYVGKDAKNNEALTFGFAKPNDVFLHARGASGSHVIIRNSSREYPQKEILQFAASIAAHYSKARSSGVVPVAYTMRKFVKKAKGKPGAVLLDREEVIFVKAGIPSKLD
jgi:predicted ribosome quality control (RQC) complex YloA/Tae2 family protein